MKRIKPRSRLLVVKNLSFAPQKAALRRDGDSGEAGRELLFRQ
ncbi:MAG: hypothetical protein ACOY3L_09775 [Pseudomonadota bacterium]